MPFVTPPFSADQFLEVFAQYNEAVWPAQIALSLLGVAAYAVVLWGDDWGDRFVSLVLAFLWAWMGVVYHFTYFAAINPAAIAFGAVFLLQSAAFVWAGVFHRTLRFDRRRGWRDTTGHFLILCTFIVYPALALHSGHVYPSVPTFGLPCPTTIFTIALLALARRPVPAVVIAVPLLWSLVGLQVAWSFGMYEDLLLLPAAAAALWIALSGRVARHS